MWIISRKLAVRSCGVIAVFDAHAFRQVLWSNTLSNLLFDNAFILMYFMKSVDLYTFDADAASAEQTYNEVCDAYSRLLTRLGLPYVRGNS